MKNIRNIIIAIVILAFLLVEPFWPKIKSAITGEDAQSSATVQTQAEGEGNETE